jgi:AraC family ethanolamine operon transcriptional activator
MFSVVETSWTALRRLQEIALLALYTEVSVADSFEHQAVSLAIKESLFAAIDAALAERIETARRSGADAVAQFKIFRRAEEAISYGLEGPIYSAGLAQEVGVSVRTLQNIVQHFRGMSLHQYLRLKRLWLVRRRLLAGAPSVKAAALAYGFWHLGDFSRSYRAVFGEMPSETLKRSK